MNITFAPNPLLIPPLLPSSNSSRHLCCLALLNNLLLDHGDDVDLALVWRDHDGGRLVLLRCRNLDDVVVAVQLLPLQLCRILKSLGLVLGVSKSDELTLPLHHLGRHVV